MMRLFLVDMHNDGMRIDLGLYKFNDVASCINAAKRRHRFIDKLETNSFRYDGELQPGPLVLEKKKRLYAEQLKIDC